MQRPGIVRGDRPQSLKEVWPMFRTLSAVALVLVAIGSFSLATAAEPKDAGGKTKSLPKELMVDLGKGIKLEMILLPAGEFKMSSLKPNKDAPAKEDLRNPVWITKPFYLGKHMVTQEQWEAVIGNNPSRSKNAKSPVDMVSWDDCQEFVKRLNKKSGEGTFQLPSDAQWEYAWHAGSTTDPVSKSKLTENKPNAWGFYDMYGSLEEWCQDSYENGDENCIRPGFRPGQGGLWRVLRTGMRESDAERYERTWSRFAGVPTQRIAGFRIAKVPAEAVAAVPLPGKSPPSAVVPFTAAAARQHQETWAKHVGQPCEVTNSLGMKLVLIPAGEFKMGPSESAEDTATLFNKTDGEYYEAKSLFRDELPQHRVRITRPFYLGTYHVTRGQFRQFVSNTHYNTELERRAKHWAGAYGWNPEKKDFEFSPKYNWRNAGFEQTDEHPVVNVCWNDAVAFCQWLSFKEGKTYRLPTEAEWEYACRAGTTTRYYSGDDPESLAKVGNVADATTKAKFPDLFRTIKASDGYVFTAPVGRFQPNAFGLYDMHGNAWQWCSDWYGDEYYTVSPVDDPTGAEAKYFCVLRGGAWDFGPFYARSASRIPGSPNFGEGGWSNFKKSWRPESAPDLRYGDAGFRVARTR
jgi:formylglycine-generating enzyme required for sulfatase activity